jgi:hypothetical protein
MTERLAEYRRQLLAILARLDQMTTDAEKMLADPADSDNAAMIDELRELLVDMQANVEQKLDKLAY